MPLLRFIAVALVAASTAAPFSAVAEPLDKECCLKLQGERRTLLTREMQAALDHGPDWVKDHLDTQKIEKVREFLDIEAMLEFRCRGGGVSKPSETAATAIRTFRRCRTASPPRRRARLQRVAPTRHCPTAIPIRRLRRPPMSALAKR